MSETKEATKTPLKRMQSKFIFNPFISDKVSESPAQKLVKYLIGGLILLPIRLVLIFIILLIWVLLLQIGAIGVKYKSSKEFTPIPRWRQIVFSIIPPVVRAMLFVCGFYWIETKGTFTKDATKVPIVVANHVSYLDAFVMASIMIPCSISDSSNLKQPLVGTYLKISQAICLDRKNPESRKIAAETIQSRATQAFKTPGFPQLLIFPEGTTTNGKSLVTFKNGAFAPGYPVQPVCLNYNQNKCDLSWTVGSPNMSRGMLDMLMQFQNHLTIHFLQPYVPTEQEKADPTMYARNVRLYMAENLNIPVTEASYDDVRFLLDAQKLKLRLSTVKNVAISQLSKTHQVSLPQAQDLLKKFAAVDSNHNGSLERDEFLHALQLPLTPDTQELFDSMDTAERGSIDFREYVIGVSTAARELADHNSLIEYCFTLFDTDGDGTLEKREFGPVMRSSFPDITDEQIDTLFNEMDTNCDGKVTYQEFEKYARTHPLYARLAQQKLEMKEKRQSLSSSDPNLLKRKDKLRSADPDLIRKNKIKSPDPSLTKDKMS